MGRPLLPSITKIEEVLDLVTDPAKYLKYMTEFKIAHDQVLHALENLDTKEKAEAFLADARMQHASAKEALTQAEVKASEVIKVASDKSQNILESAEEVHSKVLFEVEKLNSDKKKVAEQFKLIADKTASLEAYEKTLNEEKETVTCLREKTQCELDILKRKKAAFDLAMA